MSTTTEVSDVEEQTEIQECQQRLYNGTLCRRPVVTTVPLDFTDERKPVCKRHADPD